MTNTRQTALSLAPTRASLTISIVSHGHDAWLAVLLREIAATAHHCVAHVVVTHNLPPTADIALDRSWPFTLSQIVNAKPAGFGRNHNRAFGSVSTPLFCVLNPDITLSDEAIWSQLAKAALQPRVGCAYPVLRNPDGTVQDNARSVPTPAGLFRRRLLGRKDAPVDWASGAFWVVPTDVFKRLKGFDERYFMYCEDVDFCLRMQSGGWTLVQVETQAVHHAQRSSHRRLQHLAWHVRSLIRLWTGRALRAYLRRPAI